MRIALLLVGLAALDGCNSGVTSSVDGVYSGYRVRHVNVSPPYQYRMAGAVGPDGQGYFVVTGTANSTLLEHFRNLMHPGADSIDFQTSDGPNLVPVDVKPAAGGGYRFSFDFGYIDVSDVFTFKSDPVTNQPHAMAELAGNYVGVDALGDDQVTATLSPSGELKASDVGCDVSVQLDQVDDKNLYTAAVQFSGGGGCDVPMAGVAWVTDKDLSGTSPLKGTYLNIVAENTPETYATVLMLKLQ